MVGDARESLADLTDALRGWTADDEWTFRGMEMRIELQTFVDGRTADDGVWPPSYAQLVGPRARVRDRGRLRRSRPPADCRASSTSTG